MVSKLFEDHGRLAIRRGGADNRTAERIEQAHHGAGHRTVHGLCNFCAIWPKGGTSFEVPYLCADSKWAHGERIAGACHIHPMASGIQGAEISTDYVGCGGPGKPPRVRDGHRGCHAFTHYAGTWCKTQTRWLGRLIRTG